MSRAEQLRRSFRKARSAKPKAPKANAPGGGKGKTSSLAAGMEAGKKKTFKSKKQFQAPSGMGSTPVGGFGEDIKAIKIECRGSMYDNQFAFYYRAAERSDNVINKLCVVGINVRTEVLDEDQYDEHYYFGLYEEVRGQSNLVNPDPFVQGEDKYILKNFEPTFIAPIVLMVNPEMVVDQTQMKNKIPRSELINKEEQLRMQLQQKQLEISVLKHKMEEKDLAAKSIKDMERAQKKVEEELKEIMAKVEKSTKQINEEMQKNNSGIMSRLFKKEQDVLDQLKVINLDKKRTG